MQPVKRTCVATKADGSSCSAAAQPNSNYCFFHDPLKKDDRRAAQVPGGSKNRMKTLDDSSPDIQIQDTKDIKELIVQTINHVRKGKIDPRVANTLGFLVNIYVRADEQEKLQERIGMLEEIVQSGKRVREITQSGIQ